jgi:hypothetical protein
MVFLRQKAYNKEVVGSNPSTEYCMDVSYYIAINEIKVDK